MWIGTWYLYSEKEGAEKEVESAGKEVEGAVAAASQSVVLIVTLGQKETLGQRQVSYYTKSP